MLQKADVPESGFGEKSRFVPAPFLQLAFLIAGSKMQEL